MHPIFKLYVILVSSRAEIHPIAIFPTLHSSKGSPNERETFEGCPAMSACSVIFTTPCYKLFSPLVALRQIYEQRECTYFTGHNSGKKRLRSQRVVPVFYNGGRKKKMDYTALKFRSRVFIHFVSRGWMQVSIVPWSYRGQFYTWRGRFLLCKSFTLDVQPIDNTRVLSET